MAGAACSIAEFSAAWYAQVCRRDGGPGFHIVSQDIHDHGISDLLREYRERCGIGLLPKGTSTLEFVRLLREGAHIALLADISWLGVSLGRRPMPQRSRYSRSRSEMPRSWISCETI